MSQLVTQEKNNLFSSENFDQAMRMAKALSNSDLAPKDYKGRPENVLVAIQFGYELGLQPMQAIQNIAVINGKPCMWGDAQLALCQSHPDFEYIKEDELVEGGKTSGYSCVVKRKGYPEHQSTFTLVDAKQAGLLGKSGPWSQYTKRMLQMRARGFALRNIFADALKGLITREEAEDYTPSRSENASNRLNNLIENKESPRVIEETVSEAEIVIDDPIEKEIEQSFKVANNLQDLRIIFEHSLKNYPENKDFIINIKNKIKEEMSNYEMKKFNDEWEAA